MASSVASRTRREMFEEQLRNLQQDISNLSQKLSVPTLTGTSSRLGIASAGSSVDGKVLDSSFASTGKILETSFASHPSIDVSTSEAFLRQQVEQLSIDLRNAFRERDEFRQKFLQATQEIEQLKTASTELIHAKNLLNNIKQDNDALRISLESSERIRVQQKELIGILQKSHATSHNASDLSIPSLSSLSMRQDTMTSERDSSSKRSSTKVSSVGRNSIIPNFPPNNTQNTTPNADKGEITTKEKAMSVPNKKASFTMKPNPMTRRATMSSMPSPNTTAKPIHGVTKRASFVAGTPSPKHTLGRNSNRRSFKRSNSMKEVAEVPSASSTIATNTTTTNAPMMIPSHSAIDSDLDAQYKQTLENIARLAHSPSVSDLHAIVGKPPLHPTSSNGVMAHNHTTMRPFTSSGLNTPTGTTSGVMDMLNTSISSLHSHGSSLLMAPNVNNVSLGGIAPPQQSLDPLVQQQETLRTESVEAIKKMPKRKGSMKKMTRRNSTGTLPRRSSSSSMKKNKPTTTKKEDSVVDGDIRILYRAIPSPSTSFGMAKRSL